jgi:photosystem II stability/assembly factor-like uncharacterized protein
MLTLVSPDEGWAVGDVFYQSSNTPHYTGGTWHQVKNPTTEPLASIAALSPSDVWAVGAHGTILHVTGAGWSIVNGPH